MTKWRNRKKKLSQSKWEERYWKNLRNGFRNTVSGLKQHWKNSKLRGGLIITLILFGLGIVFNIHSSTQSEQKIDETKIELLEAVKSCTQSIAPLVSLSECAEKFGLTEDQIKILAENVLEVSKIETEKGWAAIIIKNFISAEEHLNKAYILNPNDIRIWRDLSFTYMNLEDYNKVIGFCNKVLSEDPSDLNCLDYRGVSFFKLDRNQEALKDGLKAQKLRPFICREFNLAFYYSGVGDIQIAKDIMDNVIKKDKNFILTCWSPYNVIGPELGELPTNFEDYNMCLVDRDTGVAHCRSIAKEGWWVTTFRKYVG